MNRSVQYLMHPFEMVVCLRCRRWLMCCQWQMSTHQCQSVAIDLRPISMTPTISKLLDAIAGGWILDAVADKLDTRQFGALKGRSTTHALIDMLHHWHAAVDSGSSFRVLFVDFAKAFYNCQTSSLIGSALSFATGVSG